MKKSLKLVGIFMLVMIVGIVGGISIYLLIANNKTYYIYDVRIVEPLSGQAYYVYTDSEAEYSLMKNKTVFMTSPEENKFEIGIYANTSTNTTKVDISSSNTNVATVTANNGHLYVNYRSAGETEITADVGGVKDTIKVIVYDNSAEELAVFDDRYYGENYSKFFKNEIVSYADDQEYVYRYETASIEGGEFSDNINNELLAIDYTQVNKEIFPENTNIQIDQVNKTLKIKCNSAALTGNTTEVIPIQSFAKSDSGELKFVKPFYVKVYIITYTPQFLQMVLSKTPHFDDGVVFMDTIPVNAGEFTDEEIEADTTILDNFLQYQIAESELKNNNESAVYNTYFTDKATKLYLQFRKVYTNGNIVYLNPLTDKENPHTLTFTDNSKIKLSADKTYYILSLDKDGFFSNPSATFDINVKLDDYDLEHTFKFEYAELNASNLDKFYSLDAKTGIYTYTYWDPRTRYNNEIYNEEGKIVGFGV